MNKAAVVSLAALATAGIGTGFLWVQMPPLGYDWAPPVITDWQRVRTAKALVRRELGDPESAEFLDTRISDKTLFGTRKKGDGGDEDNFFAVCGEVKDMNAPGDAEKSRKFAVHFDIEGGRGRAFIEPEDSEMAALFESAMAPCR